MKRTFGLIGYPLAHSFSKKYFTEKFEKENIPNCEYENFSIENINLLPRLVSENPTLSGFNVTFPYKESIAPFIDELDETAKKIGAVNCVKVVMNKEQPENGQQNYGYKLIGYNTDAFGFKQSIKPFLEAHHERALILGTGGGSKAVAFILKEIGIDCYFVSRNKYTNSYSRILGYEDINPHIINAFKLIINTTPLGMFPNVNTSPDLPYPTLSASHLLYDLVYNPVETEFLKKGRLQGATGINGLSMLHQQAEKAWEIWNL